jgi:hypothetical protein
LNSLPETIPPRGASLWLVTILIAGNPRTLTFPDRQRRQQAIYADARMRRTHLPAAKAAARRVRREVIASIDLSFHRFPGEGRGPFSRHPRCCKMDTGFRR